MFEYKTDREIHIGYYISKVKIIDYKVIIDGRTFFDQPIKNDLKRDYTSASLLDFKEHYKLIAIDLSKQQKLDADPKAIQESNFTENLENNATIFFSIEEAKETVLDFSKGTVQISSFCFVLI